MILTWLDFNYIKQNWSLIVPNDNQRADLTTFRNLCGSVYIQRSQNTKLKYTFLIQTELVKSDWSIYQYTMNQDTTIFTQIK